MGPVLWSGAMASGAGGLGGFLSGLSGAGSFLSGLGGLFGGSSGMSNKQASRLAVEAEQRAIQNQRVIDIERPSWLRKGAQDAGFHPLALLGMNPVNGPSSLISPTGGDNFFDRMSAAGQGLDRAAAALQSREERSFNRAVQMQSLERGSLENELLRSQIARERAQLAPAVSENVGYVDKNVIPMWTTLRTPGGDKLIPNPDYAQIMENYFPEAFEHMIGDYRPGGYGRGSTDPKGNWASRWFKSLFRR